MGHLNKHTTRGIWSLPESRLHINFLELKAVFLDLKEFQDLCPNKIVLVAMDNTTVVSYINKKGGMRSGSLCALLWRMLTWCSRKQVTLKARHIPGQLNVVADKLSRLGQTIQTKWSLLPEVFKSICSRWHWPKIDLFVTSVCVNSTGSPGMGSGCAQPTLGGSGCVCLPTSSQLGQSGGDVAGPPVHRVILIAPRWPNMPWFWDLEAMSSQIPLYLPNLLNLSTRSVYEAKCTIFTNWCLTNQLDFRAPPVKSIADFLLYLFQVRKLQPSPIEHRSGIADKLGNSPINVSKDENLTHLLDSFHRGRPKGRRGIPSWNLSLVLHRLTKAPFEPLKEASLKHLTFKTVFLLGLCKE